MKKLIHPILLVAVAVIALSSCNQSKTSKYDRPLDHWVFRSVMDSIPRILTTALSEDVWAAYSAQNGVLYKVWKGSVNFDGAVYTTAHGPQPTTIGDAWFENAVQQPWAVVRNGKTETPTLAYKGHRFKDEQVEVMYELGLSDGTKIKIFEKPEAMRKGDLNGFERTFSVENLPSDAVLTFETNVSSVAMASSITTDGKWEETSSKPRNSKGIKGLDITGKLTLNANKTTTLAVIFTQKPLLPNYRNRQTAEEEEIPEGAKLIAKSDCRTCHNAYEQTVGPAYIEVAKRYETTEDNINTLVAKVMNGGSGVWGEAAMTAHSDLAKEDVRKMVEYVLSLDAESEGEGSVGGFNEVAKADYLKPDAGATDKNLLPGVLAKVYTFKKDLNTLADVNTSQKPVYGGVLTKIFAYAEDFKELSDNFAIIYEGYLNIEDAGTYILRLSSDDGSRLSINGKVVIDHDGLHGATPKDAAVGLEKGLHPFKLEFFQGLGGRAVGLEWRRFDQSEFTIVPQTAMLHDATLRDALVGLKMPLGDENTIPGDRSPVAGVHPSFTLSQARPSSFLPKVGGMDFLPDGRMVVSTWEPTGSVYILDNLDQDDPEKITVKRIAKGLAEPLGLKVVDGEIYVLQKQELTKLVDVNGDEMIDEYQTVSNQWRVSANFHEFAFGLVYKDGYFYATLATAILPGGASASPQIPDRGKVVKISKKDGSTEFLAHGLRTPNGIGIGHKDEIFVADNQGDWLPSSKIVHVKKGAWYGSRSVDFEGTATLEETQPVVWLPQDEIGNSPSQPGILKDGIYKGQMIHGEVTHGGLKRVFVEEVDGQLQGALFRFTQGMEAGINRLAWGTDGALYVGGIGNPGNWQHSGTLWYGLQRFKFNGNSTFEMLAVRAKSNGLEIEFTEPIGERYGNSPVDYQIKQWYYLPNENYGGPKMNETTLPVQSVHVSEDRKKVFLQIGGIKPKHVVYLRLDGTFISQNDHELWSTECWYTMNAIPKNQLGFVRPAVAIAPNTLLPSEQKDGWQLLFDGKTTKGWRNFRKKTVGASWKIQDDALVLVPDAKGENGWQVKDGGDIITDGEYENFELCLDWKIQNCGNSGIIFNVVESDKYDFVWQTGPEMQVLDNICHPDSRFKTHRAGDLYDLLECKYVTVKQGGEWNSVRLVVRNGKTEHWLNGKKVVEYEMFTDEWRKMIANSKFKEMPDFGKARKGHIALQDHGDKVWYRNIRIRPLGKEVQ